MSQKYVIKVGTDPLGKYVILSNVKGGVKLTAHIEGAYAATLPTMDQLFSKLKNMGYKNVELVPI